MSRYSTRNVIRVPNHSFTKSKNKRGIKNISVYETPKFSREALETIDYGSVEPHLWKIGSRFYKLAYEYYGDSTLWWVIAFYNKKPTDSHVKIGEVIYVPTSPELIQEVVGI